MLYARGKTAVYRNRTLVPAGQLFGIRLDEVDNFSKMGFDIIDSNSPESVSINNTPEGVIPEKPRKSSGIKTSKNPEPKNEEQLVLAETPVNDPINLLHLAAEGPAKMGGSRSKVQSRTVIAKPKEA